MIQCISTPVLLKNGVELCLPQTEQTMEAGSGTIAMDILQKHNSAAPGEGLRLRFDALASHDITYVGIVQTARASGLVQFPVPYVLTNCHNSLCAVGGTINEDDHLFGLSAAQKYGGIYVPAHGAVIHQYMREAHAACGGMILGSDSHTRYGAIGTLSIGEGGPELVKQLLCKTYDIPQPEVVAVVLEGAPQPGVGPQDVALALIGATFESGFVKNAVLEFVGSGIANLSMEYRIGIDVMTTETTCLSSIWATDEKTQEYLEIHGRGRDYKALAPQENACYNRAVKINLSEIRPMAALPFHPSNVYPIEQLCADGGDILRALEEKIAAEAIEKGGEEAVYLRLTDKLVNGRMQITQGIIAGCAGGTYENICAAADILNNGNVGSGAFTLSVYPASQPVTTALMQNGVLPRLIGKGAVIKTAFCGPCFGAGDVPANNELSIRHTTRNFPSREGAKPGAGQSAGVALMDARSIAATAANGGILTAATERTTKYESYPYHYDDAYYRSRVYQGFGKPDDSVELRFGPNIMDWPSFCALTENLILKVASVIDDPVTTTDELIPSGETSSYRSNPEKLAGFTLSRKDPGYVGRSRKVRALEIQREEGKLSAAALEMMYPVKGITAQNTGIGSVIFAKKPGDGSAREQAASCQKVLGGWANIANEYATKRYRSNLINWGMLPLLTDLAPEDFEVGDYLFIPGIQALVAAGAQEIPAQLFHDDIPRDITLTMAELTPDEREIILAGCLMNYYKGEEEA